MLGRVARTTKLPWWWLRAVTSLLNQEQWNWVEACKKRKTEDDGWNSEFFKG